MTVRISYILLLLYCLSRTDNLSMGKQKTDKHCPIGTVDRRTRMMTFRQTEPYRSNYRAASHIHRTPPVESTWV